MTKEGHQLFWMKSGPPSAHFPWGLHIGKYGPAMERNCFELYYRIKKVNQFLLQELDLHILRRDRCSNGTRRDEGLMVLVCASTEVRLLIIVQFACVLFSNRQSKSCRLDLIRRQTDSSHVIDNLLVIFAPCVPLYLPNCRHWGQ